MLSVYLQRVVQWNLPLLRLHPQLRLTSTMNRHKKMNSCCYLFMLFRWTLLAFGMWHGVIWWAVTSISRDHIHSLLAHIPSEGEGNISCHNIRNHSPTHWHSVWLFQLECSAAPMWEPWIWWSCSALWLLYSTIVMISQENLYRLHNTQLCKPVLENCHLNILIQ